MNYAKIKDGAVEVYPYGFNQLRRDNPNTSFPANFFDREDELPNFNVVKVADSEKPSKKGWVTVEEVPLSSGGAWLQNWTLVPKSATSVTRDEMELVDPPEQEGHGAVEVDPVLDGDVWKQTWSLVEKPWLENRIASYGESPTQIEFITENGLKAWQEKVAEIKAKYPKS